MTKSQKKRGREYRGELASKVKNLQLLTSPLALALVPGAADLEGDCNSG
jgi:hypothetical protein